MLAEKLISRRRAKLNGEIVVDTLLHPATPNFPSHSSAVVLTRPVALIPEREIERKKQSPATSLPQLVTEMNASAWYEALGLLHLNPGVTLSALDENYLYVAEHQSVSPFTRFLVLLPKPIAKNIVIQLSGEVKKQVIKELDQFQDSDETVLASRVQALTDLLT